MMTIFILKDLVELQKLLKLLQKLRHLKPIYLIMTLDLLTRLMIMDKNYVFDIRYQKKLQSAQPIKADFKFSEKIPAGTYGYALVFANKLVNIISDGQHHFD